MDKNSKTIRTLPSITEGTEATLQNLDPKEQRIIIQEKVDGSQLTIFKSDGVLHFYNKNKPCHPQGAPFLNAFLSLQCHPEFFKEGYFYHGESMKSKRTITCEYQRVPRFYWIVYEIVKEDNYILTPEEMTEHLANTGIETVQILYDSKDQPETDLVKFVPELLHKLETGEIKSSLGNLCEGFVLKRLNQIKDDKLVISRAKFVRTKFQEQHHQKKGKIQEVSDEQFIKEIGEIYNTNARRNKAIQHLQDKGNWDDKKLESNISKMVAELDNDLLKEAEQDIKNMLFVRFWPEISRIARGDVSTHVKGLVKDE